MVSEPGYLWTSEVAFHSSRQLLVENIRCVWTRTNGGAIHLVA